MNTLHAVIAQASTPPQPPPGVTEWGILGAIVFFVVKEGVSFLKQKDDSESSLTNTLITDIRNTNRELREYLEKERKASDSTIATIDRVEQKLSRNQTEIIVSHRESLARLTAMVAALHNRLDRSGITISHSDSEER